ncbi:TadE/TadG family type IV pilus assembly protein [Sphingomonas sp. CFBP8993]|uniref:TadE/TadG family type IV pilus assembly protein n=1 Tax=Sphingomonas sp. CFBP8993 TaxID=3096526 RepID=UPI002A6B6F29|nr:TadE/TadG family type IV pilus assembly protein [Sphingomonas sp. CFBP8993]MDY0957938.1 TadE/TadG family type IV pilus assembly protein [Sphingomonas sp. CFBP8993]
MNLSFLRAVSGVLRHRRGAVMMMFALALPVLVFSIGMGIDYARAMKARTKLNAIADSAALSAVSKTALGMSDDAAVAYALRVFNAQATSLVNAGEIAITNVAITAPTDNMGRRNAVVTYTGTSNNVFAAILGVNTLAISGQSQTTNATAPDIDFYMLLDVSSSMALPTTSAGLAKVAASNSQKCQFACHSTNDLTGRDANGNVTDLYGVAKSYGLNLRIDEEGAALSKLADTATSTSSKNGAQYQIAIATFRGKGGFAILQGKTPHMADAASKSKDLKPSLFYKNGCPTSACQSTEVGFRDTDTGTSDAMDQINSQLITAPGTGIGTAAAQGVMFIVTDGMRDEYRASGVPEIPLETAKCDMIKARGIRIAVLYTEYLSDALTGDPWSEKNVAPYLYKIEPALQACASPGLYTKVSTDQDIAAAMGALFQTAVATARITR